MSRAWRGKHPLPRVTVASSASAVVPRKRTLSRPRLCAAASSSARALPSPIKTNSAGCPVKFLCCIEDDLQAIRWAECTCIEDDKTVPWRPKHDGTPRHVPPDRTVVTSTPFGMT